MSVSKIPLDSSVDNAVANIPYPAIMYMVNKHSHHKEREVVIGSLSYPVCLVWKNGIKSP